MSNYDISVIVGGREVDTYSHKGELYIEGREGSSYKLRLRNNTYQEALFVVSVDGLSINDGKPASKDSDGFIVRANGTWDIEGWLVDNSTAAKFVFGSKKASYAAESGNDVNNTGVIGLQVFQKKVTYVPPVVVKEYVPYPVYPRPYYPVYPRPYPYHYPHWYWDGRYSAPVTYDVKSIYTLGQITSGGAGQAGSGWGGGGGDASGGGAGRGDASAGGRGSSINALNMLASSASYHQSSQQVSNAVPTSRTRAGFVGSAFGASGQSVPEVENTLGTEFGEATTFNTISVEFVRDSSTPVFQKLLYYGDKEYLNALGIQLNWQKPKSTVKPKAFPADGFCEPPKNWKGK